MIFFTFLSIFEYVWIIMKLVRSYQYIQTSGVTLLILHSTCQVIAVGHVRRLSTVTVSGHSVMLKHARVNTVSPKLRARMVFFVHTNLIRYLIAPIIPYVVIQEQPKKR